MKMNMRLNALLVTVLVVGICPLVSAETIGDSLDFAYGETDGWAGGIMLLVEEQFSEPVVLEEWAYLGANGGDDSRYATPLILTDIGNDEYEIKGIGSPLQWPGPGDEARGPFGLTEGSDVVDPGNGDFVAAWHGNLELGETNTGAVSWEGGGGLFAHDVGTNPGDPDTTIDDIAVGGVVMNGNGVAVTSRRSYAISFTGTPGGGHGLQAGDANMDLKFDQIDLVQVQVAAKYLTGQPATWGEGDWDGAPGGAPGNPPPGDGVFSQLDIIAALNANVYLTGPYAAVVEAPAGDGNATLVYNPGTGELAVEVGATELTSINIDSAAAIFTGDAAMNLGGSFDNDADNNIFKATFGSSFGSLSFGNVAQTGLSKDLVLNDLTVIGSLSGGGDLGNVDLRYVPEPSTLVLAGVGLVGLVGLLRRRFH